MARKYRVMLILGLLLGLGIAAYAVMRSQVPATAQIPCDPIPGTPVQASSSARVNFSELAATAAAATPEPRGGIAVRPPLPGPERAQTLALNEPTATPFPCRGK